MTLKNKKMKNLGPRRKRMTRSSRLPAAKHWISTYMGENIVRGYKNCFGVDFQCAVHELRMLNVKIDEQYVSRAMAGIKQNLAAKKNLKKAEETMLLEDSDEYFYFIAGYTSGGVPYGVTWEEAVSQGLI